MINMVAVISDILVKTFQAAQCFCGATGSFQAAYLTNEGLYLSLTKLRAAVALWPCEKPRFQDDGHGRESTARCWGNAGSIAEYCPLHQHPTHSIHLRRGLYTCVRSCPRVAPAAGSGSASMPVVLEVGSEWIYVLAAAVGHPRVQIPLICAHGRPQALGDEARILRSCPRCPGSG